MAQGEFTKEEAKETITAVEEMWKALSKPKQGEYFGHLNDIMLFITAAACTVVTLCAHRVEYDDVFYLNMAVSAVDHPANKRRWLVVKRADTVPEFPPGFAAALEKKIVRRGEQYCVTNADGSRTLGCHDTQAAAAKQLRAIEANKAAGDDPAVDAVAEFLVERADETPTFQDSLLRERFTAIFDELNTQWYALTRTIDAILFSDEPKKEAKVKKAVSDFTASLKKSLPKLLDGLTVKGESPLMTALATVQRALENTMPKTQTTGTTVAKIDAKHLDGVATEVTEHIAALQKRDEEREGAIEQLVAEAVEKALADAGVKKGDPTPEDILKSLAPEARAFVIRTQADAAAAKKEAEKATALAKAEADKRINREYVEKAQLYAVLPVNPEKDAAVLRAIDEKLTKDEAARVLELFRAGDNAKLLEQVGDPRPRDAEAGSAWGKLQAKAKVRLEKGDAKTIEQALALVGTENPELERQANEDDTNRMMVE